MNKILLTTTVVITTTLLNACASSPTSNNQVYIRQACEKHFANETDALKRGSKIKACVRARTQNK